MEQPLGAEMWYQERDGEQALCTVVAVHATATPPYYTVRFANGDERQTTRERLFEPGEPLVMPRLSNANPFSAEYLQRTAPVAGSLKREELVVGTRVELIADAPGQYADGDRGNVRQALVGSAFEVVLDSGRAVTVRGSNRMMVLPNDPTPSPRLPPMTEFALPPPAPAPLPAPVTAPPGLQESAQPQPQPQSQEERLAAAKKEAEEQARRKLAEVEQLAEAASPTSKVPSPPMQAPPAARPAPEQPSPPAQSLTSPSSPPFPMRRAVKMASIDRRAVPPSGQMVPAGRWRSVTTSQAKLATYLTDEAKERLQKAQQEAAKKAKEAGSAREGLLKEAERAKEAKKEMVKAAARAQEAAEEESKQLAEQEEREAAYRAAEQSMKVGPATRPRGCPHPPPLKPHPAPRSQGPSLTLSRSPHPPPLNPPPPVLKARLSRSTLPPTCSLPGRPRSAGAGKDRREDVRGPGAGSARAEKGGGTARGFGCQKGSRGAG